MITGTQAIRHDAADKLRSARADLYSIRNAQCWRNGQEKDIEVVINQIDALYAMLVPNEPATLGRT